MKVQKNTSFPHSMPSTDKEYQDLVQVIHTTYKKQIYAFRAAAIQKCKKADNLAAIEQQRIQRQYQDQVMFLQSVAVKMIDKIAQKHNTIEIACDTSHEHLKQLSNQATVLLTHYRMSKLAEPDLYVINITDEDITHTFESQQTRVEQYYQTLEDLWLPKLFLRIRPLLNILGYICPIVIILTFLYGYEMLYLSSLYMIIPITLTLILFAVGGGCFFLWQHAKRDVHEVYGDILEALERAYKILQQQTQETQQHLEQELNKVQHTKEIDMQRLQQATTLACSRIRARRDASFCDIGKNLLHIEKDLRDKRDQALHHAYQQYQHRN